MVETALHETGGVGYLVEQAHKNPAAFLALLARLLPRDVKLSAKSDRPLVVITLAPLLSREEWLRAHGVQEPKVPVIEHLDETPK